MKLYHTVSIHILYATTSCNRFSSNILNSFYFRRSCLIFVRDLRVWLYYKKYIIYQTIHAWIVSLVCEPWLFTPDFKSHLKLCLEFRIRRTDHQSKRTELLRQVLSIQVWVLTFCLLAGRWVGLSLLYLLSSLSVKCIREWCWKTNRHTCNGQSCHQN